MKDSTNNSNGAGTTNIVQPQQVEVSTWVTVNTSTTENVTRMEISKSDDFDRVIKTK